MTYRIHRHFERKINVKKFKRFLSGLVLGTVFCTSFTVPYAGIHDITAYASDTSADIVFQGVSEKLQANDLVSLLVFEGDALTPESPQNIVYFDQTLTGEGGTFCFEVSPDVIPESYMAQVKVAGEKDVRIYAPSNTVLEEDFEDYAGGYSDKWGMSGTSQSNFTAEEVDAQHGKSLALRVTDNGAAKFAYYFEENTPYDKVYHLSFDVRTGENNGNFYIRLLDERYTTDNTANDDYMHESFFVRRDNTGTAEAPVYSRTIGYYQGTMGWTTKSMKDLAVDSWHDIDMWLDAGKQRVFYAVDGIVMAQTDFDTKGNDLKGMLLTYSGNEEAFYIDNIKWEKTDYNTRIALQSQGVAVPEELALPLELSVQSERTGNIFFDEEPMNLHISANNLTKDAYQKEYSVKIKDVKGTEVWSKEVHGTIEASAVTKLGFIPESLKYGVYDIEIYEGEELVCTAKTSRSVKSYVKNPKVGICTHIGGKGRGDSAKAMELIEALGVGYTRDDWPRWIEEEKGVYSDYFETDPNFSVYLRESAEHDVNMLVLLGNPNSDLYKDEDLGFYTSDEALTAMTNYCTWLADKFKGKVKYYEIGNEVNYYTNKDGSPAPAADYVEVLDAAYRGIKAGDDNAKVIAFGGASVEFITEGLDTMVVNGSFPFDGISVHPYHTRWDPEKADANMYDDDSWIGRGNTLKALIASYAGLEDKEIWATELGYYTQNESGYGKQTESNQASYLVRMLALNEAYDFHDMMFVFEMIDSGTDLLNKENNFGVLNCYKTIDTPYSAKAAYPALSFWNKLMAGAKATGINTSGSSEYVSGAGFVSNYIYNAGFDKNGTKINVMWNYMAEETGKAKTLSFTVGGKAYEVYDMYGNILETGSGVDSIDVAVGEEPIFVVVPGDSFEALQGRNIVIDLSEVKDGEKLTFKCKLSEDKAGVFVAAMYKDNILIDAITSATNQDGTATMEFTYKDGCNRVMMTVFDNLSNIKPIVEAVNIN